MYLKNYNAKSLIQCTNCVYTNLQHKTKYYVKHSANNFNVYEILKRKIKNIISNVDYSIMPIIPNYLASIKPQTYKNNYLNNKRRTHSTSRSYRSVNSSNKSSS